MGLLPCSYYGALSLSFPSEINYLDFSLTRININVRWLINFLKKEIKKGKPEFGKLKTRKDENIKVYPNILKAKKILNWRPKKNLIKELKKQIKFHKSNSF